MRSAVLAGIDIGTTNTKVCCYDAAGRRLAGAARATGDDGTALLDSVYALLAEVAAVAGPPDAVGITSMAESGMALDDRMRPLGPLIRWNDPTGDEAVAVLAPYATDLWRRSGVNLAVKTPVARWLGLRQRQPDAWRRMRWWVNTADLVAAALTGDVVTDPTLAARTGARDIAAGEWNAEMLAFAGLDAERLPRVTTDSVPARAGEHGIPPGVPVLVAGHDHLVATHAVGVRAPGRTADSMGTAEALVTISPVPPPDDVEGSGISWNHQAGGPGYSLLSGFPDSGRLGDWFARLHPGGLDLAARARLPTGLVVEPYLRGRAAPQPDPVRRLTVSGMSEAHGAAEFAAGLLEGACFQARWVAEEQCRVAGQSVAAPTVFGGPTRNERWMQIKAAVMPDGIYRAPFADAAVLGAAMLAARSIGVELPVPEGIPQRSGPELHDAYDTIYRNDFLPRVGAEWRPT